MLDVPPLRLLPAYDAALQALPMLEKSALQVCVQALVTNMTKIYLFSHYLCNDMVYVFGAGEISAAGMCASIGYINDQNLPV